MFELNRIYNEDCLEGMRWIPDGSVDMVLCDLPYGTTAVACINTGRNFIGFELDKNYWEIANKRIEDTLSTKTTA